MQKQVDLTITVMIGVLFAFMGFLGGMLFYVKLIAPPHTATTQVSRPQNQRETTAGDFEQKRALLEKAAKSDPKNPTVWKHLGDLNFDANRPAKAVEAYLKYLALDPKNADVWTDLGVMYRRLGKAGKAIECFDKAISITPTHEVSRFNKGIVLMHDIGDTKGAVETWNSLLKLNPKATTPQGRPLAELVKELSDSSEKKQ